MSNATTPAPEAQATSAAIISPPYVGYGVFKSTIEQLAETVVPSGPLDRRVLSWLSGADYPALISALRFLGLINEDRKATHDLHALAKTVKTADWKVDLLAVLLTKYGPIINGLDLEKGTMSELEQAFKNYGVSSGQMVTKSIRFLLKALTDANMPVSPHILKAKPKPQRAKTAAKTKARAQRSLEREPDGGAKVEFPATPKGFDRMPIPGVPNAFIQYPHELSTTDCDLFSAAVTMLRAYATARTGGGKEKPK